MATTRWQWLAAAAVGLGGFLLIPSQAQAQTGKIVGLVTDATSGAPVEGVQVFVQGTGYGSATNAAGRYFIIAVPPGTYTLSARRIGYQTNTKEGVTVRIDATTDIAFKMNVQTRELATETITAAAEAPLFDVGTTGSTTTITAEQIATLPVTSISGILSLQQGFVDVPQNTQLISLAEEQRSTVSPIRVRGGRGGSTTTLIDGIPVNNPIFGTAAINLNSLAVSSVNFERGFMEPQYGGALAGSINQAVREGSPNVAGSINYQSSAIAGALGSRADELQGSNFLNGYLSGPIPATSNRLFYLLSGQLQSAAAAVYKFDDLVNSYSNPRRWGQGRTPNSADLIPGWRAFGGRQDQQMVGKLTFVPTASMRVNATVIDQERQVLGYDRRYYLVQQGDPWGLVNTLIDSLGIQGRRANRDVTQASVRDHSRLYAGSAEQRFGRTNVQLRVGYMDFERNTCNIFLGACVPGPFVQANFDETFINAFAVPGIPYPGSGMVYGGEKYNTFTLRGDVQSQMTDHHNIQGGVQFVRHDLSYNQLTGSAINSGIAPAVNQTYRAKPTEAATYLQDRIEYDFLTVKVGARFDYGKATGLGFADPLNPNNGTTAREVCNGQAPSLGSRTPYTYTDTKGTATTTDDETYTGLAACTNSAPTATSNGKPGLLYQATQIAARDDFREAKARTAFSPRIGISFPLTEKSSVFFNAGRYTMIPLYSNIYRNTAIGTVAADNECYQGNQTKPNSKECLPPIGSGLGDFIGNPSLLLEQATQYEIGYGAELNQTYSVNFAIYNRDETGLSGVRTPELTPDVGATYFNQSLPLYRAIINQDFLTSRGIEVQFRRRLKDRWSFDINYGWSRATTNSPPPDREVEIESSGERNLKQLRELPADIDRTHTFNTTLTYSVRNDVPKMVWGLGRALRNTSATLTYSFNSGFPYTPVRAATIGAVSTSINAADILSGRAPSVQIVNLQARKDFNLRNMRYGAIVRVNNLLDRKNCNQVYANTGTCDTGARDFNNRRVGNGQSSSTSFDQPEYVAARRTVNAGITLSF